MTWMQWMMFFLVLQAVHGLGTWKLYLKAGRKAWEAFVPVYNAVVLMKIINRPVIFEDGLDISDTILRQIGGVARTGQVQGR